MIHNNLCGLSKPCDDEIPEHGYCGFSAPRYCIHCMTWCICDELQQERDAALDAAREAVEGLLEDTADEGVVEQALAAIDALREGTK